MKRLLIFPLLLLSFSIHAQTTIMLEDEVVQSVERRIEFGFKPSIAIGIVDEDGMRFFNFGMTKKNGVEVDEHTIYEIGSISKVFTGILLAIQVEEGMVKLDDPIQKYLPQEVKVPSRNDQEIALGNLSDHTSGLPRLPGNMMPKNPNNPYADYTVEQLYDFLSAYELPRDIGEKYEYSNLAQGLLGNILALNEHVSYETLMMNHIAQPLDMSATKITLDEEMQKHLAVGHSEEREVENWDIPTLAGAGAIRSSTADMLKFLQANLGLIGNPLKEAMDLSHTPRHDMAGNYKVGLAWHINPGDEGEVLWHNGGTGGYRAFAGFVKETKKGVVVLTNSTESVDDIGFHLLNSGSKLRIIQASFAEEFKAIVKDEGIDAGIDWYQMVKKEHPDEYRFVETEINAIALSYQDKDIFTALPIFELNTKEFPDSYRAFNFYANGLLKKGDEANATINYKKSIELYPANTNGIKKLKELGVEVDPMELEQFEKSLEHYLGTYEIKPDLNMTITRDGTKIYGLITGQGQFRLFAKNKTDYFLKAVDAQIIFNEADQKVDSLTLIQNGATINCQRIE